MRNAQLKTGCFILEGLNSFATVFYSYYLYFFMQKAFGFGNQANLELAALNGGIYMLGAWAGGRFAQRFGYFTALKLGFGIMLGAMAAGTLLDSALAHVLVMAAYVLGMCFTWPTLEALVSEGEDPAGLQRMVGIYNVVWAGTAALAYFTGGAILDNLGLKSLFYVPMASLVAQIALTFWLEARAKPILPAPVTTSVPEAPASPAKANIPLAQSVATGSNPRPIAKAKTFLRMAWLANPFAYIAINTLVAVMPGLAKKLELSTMLAGFCCSVWCFARVASFFGLWFWNGWHYKFRWLLATFLALIITFALILSVPHLAVLVIAQIIFGGALGLIYYSSLFYSMDISEAKGEHGGIHEAAIGLGNCAGPAVGAISLYFLPQYTYSGAVAVTGLLLLGLGGLVAIWRRREFPNPNLE